MGELKNVPAIRFKGFTNKWSKDLLRELCDVYDGTHQTPIYTNSGVMFLSVENIKTLKSDKYISKEAFEKEFKTYPQSGDVLMTRIGDIGTANVVDTNVPIAYYVSLALLKQKKLHPYFLKHSISTQAVVNDLWRRTLHIAFPKKINKNEIAKVEIPYPIEDEQTQIGSYFQNIDKLISLHQAKVNKLINLKKAMLEKMFPKQGADVPEIRFEGFSGAWEERGFDELFCSIATKNYQILSSEILETGDFRVVDQGQNRVIGYSYDESKLFSNLPIIVFGDHTTILKYVDFNFIVGADGVKILKNKIGNLRFLYYCLEFNKIEPEGYKRHFSILRAIIMLIPKSPEEQTKIGAYFQNLDKTITLYQKELEKLTNLKKACLEKMFV